MPLSLQLTRDMCATPAWVCQKAVLQKDVGCVFLWTYLKQREWSDRLCHRLHPYSSHILSSLEEGCFSFFSCTHPLGHVVLVLGGSLLRGPPGPGPAGRRFSTLSCYSVNFDWPSRFLLECCSFSFLLFVLGWAFALLFLISSLGSSEQALWTLRWGGMVLLWTRKMRWNGASVNPCRCSVVLIGLELEVGNIWFGEGKPSGLQRCNHGCSLLNLFTSENSFFLECVRKSVAFVSLLLAGSAFHG